MENSRRELVVGLENVTPGPGHEAGQAGLVLGERGRVGQLRGVHLTLLLRVLIQQCVDEWSESISEVLWRYHIHRVY